MVIDENEVLERLGGNKDLVVMLLNKFIGDYQSFKDDITNFLASGQTDEAVRHVHSIKGAAANLAMHDLTDKAKVAEEELKAGGTLATETLDALNQSMQDLVSASNNLFQ